PGQFYQAVGIIRYEQETAKRVYRFLGPIQMNWRSAASVVGSPEHQAVRIRDWWGASAGFHAGYWFEVSAPDNLYEVVRDDRPWAGAFCLHVYARAVIVV